MSDVNFTAQRKILVWNYQQGGSTATSRIRPGASSEVFQFTMPGATSEQLPSASLVSITSPSDNKSPHGAVAISAFGQLRYWPRLSEPHRCTDAAITLSGDEVCSSLNHITGTGNYVLATSIGRIILVSFQGTHSVLQRELRAPSSVLSTVGSWLGFGSKSKETLDSGDQLVGVRITTHQGFALLWVFKASGLNVWLAQPQRPETLVLNTNILQPFEAMLHEEEEAQYGGTLKLDLSIFDFQVQVPSDTDQSALITLLVGSSPSMEQNSASEIAVLDQRGDHMEYHMACYEVDIRGSGGSPVTTIRPALVSTSLLPEEIAMSEEFPTLTLPTEDPVAYVHWRQFAICAPVPDNGEHNGTEILDVTRNPAHRIFGFGSTPSAVLYFTPSHGIVKLQISETYEADVRQGQTQSGSSMDTGAKHLTTNSGGGFMAQASADDILAEAFHLYMAQSSHQHLSSPSLRYPWSSLIETLKQLDFESAVRTFSGQIADSRPAEDPRWPEYSARMASGGHSSTSNNGSANAAEENSYNNKLHALLCRQIEDKQELHSNFIRFMMEVDLWDRLALSTRDYLEQMTERFTSAVQLRAKHNECIQRQHSSRGPSVPSGSQSIFQQAIEASLITTGVSRAQWERAGLSAQDIYYAKVSNIESILGPSLAALKTQLGAKLSVESQFNLIVQNNDIFQAIFSSAQLCRSQQSRQFFNAELADSNGDGDSESLNFARAQVAQQNSFIGAAWTRTFNPLLRETIRIARQFADQIMQSRPATGAGANASNTAKSLGSGFSGSAFDVDIDLLHDQLFYLTDALLSDWIQDIIRCQGQEPRRSEELNSQFSTLRSELLSPFKNIPSQHEMGLQLCQKYREFLVIVEICELQNDDVKLWSFAEYFSPEDHFERVVFEFYSMNKQYFKLLTPPKAYWKSLRKYLDESGVKSLAWNHLVRTGDYKAAEEMFDSMAGEELDSSFKQTTLLSLAKISELASGVPVSKVNEEREQRLYLRNAQLAIRAMFDHTDDDSTPVSAGTLVQRLLGYALGNDSVEPGYSLQLALDLYRNTIALRTEFENRDMLKEIWHKILSLEHWPDLADALQRGDIDDDTLQQNVQESLFFSIGMNLEVISDELPAGVFVEVAKQLYGEDAAALRVLGDAFDMLYRSKGASPPNLSGILLPGARTGMETDEDVVEEEQQDMEE